MVGLSKHECFVEMQRWKKATHKLERALQFQVNGFHVETCSLSGNCLMK